MWKIKPCTYPRFCKVPSTSSAETHAILAPLLLQILYNRSDFFLLKRTGTYHRSSNYRVTSHLQKHNTKKPTRKYKWHCNRTNDIRVERTRNSSPKIEQDGGLFASKMCVLWTKSNFFFCYIVNLRWYSIGNLKQLLCGKQSPSCTIFARLAVMVVLVRLGGAGVCVQIQSPAKS